MYRNKLKDSPPKNLKSSFKDIIFDCSLKKKILLSLSLLSILSYGLYYYDFIGSKNKYIYDHNLPMFKEFEWATWKDSVGGRMAHDPKWFKLPPEKYLTKEVPFNWNSVRGKSALIKRNAYFKHLCNTEAISYYTDEMPRKEIRSYTVSNKSFIYLRKATLPVKNMKNVLENLEKELIDSQKYNKREVREKISKTFNRMLKTAQQNPYINPNFGYLEFSEGIEKKFDLYDITKDYYDRARKNLENFPTQNTIREYMLDNGDIYQNRFDVKTLSFLPFIKVEKSEAQYYILYREIERKKMHDLGIWGQEGIIVNSNDKKVVSYYKSFLIPAYLDSTRGTNLKIPINWSWSISCGSINENTKEIKEF